VTVGTRGVQPNRRAERSGLIRGAACIVPILLILRSRVRMLQIQRSSNRCMLTERVVECQHVSLLEISEKVSTLAKGAILNKRTVPSHYRKFAKVITTWYLWRLRSAKA
jgi:hypothetical protein